MKPNTKLKGSSFYDGGATLVLPNRRPSHLRRNILAGVFSIAVLYAWLLSVPTYHDAIDIHQSVGSIKHQILSHVPIGTPVASAAQFMRANRFKCEWYKKDFTVNNGISFYTPEDELYCHREDGLLVTHDCKVIFACKNGYVTALEAHIGETGP